MTETEWLRVGPLEDLPVKGAARVDTQTGKVGLYRMADDRVFAVEDRCPHAYALLSYGWVDPEKESVICPLHGWVVALRTGEVTFPTDSGSVRVFPVRICDGFVEINVPLS